MNVKWYSSFVRNILYFQSVIRNKTIAKTAQLNGIKPGNLSKLISELEQTVGCLLLDRSVKGVTPTREGQRIYELGLRLENTINEIKNLQSTAFINPQHIYIYIASDVEIPCLNEFIQKHPELKIINTEDINYSDLAVLNQKPENPDISYTHCTLGNEFRQNIWITCNEKHPNAMLLFDFIIAKIVS